ncbi:MBL fold metallo-hydrolase [Allosphingosinicella indica]|uniref:Glyoxylase, beta-lactamase superfamily II n=1 Tax=Allosphingosinicella indica TaxID=941907 RepID=A0A1X7H0S8_9SPHN|nr:MBL fold metallo-hydrolase [Allosphingosinicella indica]SMF77639.1 Glyoxylase, beta-lactamase superfamily II [Allosphingosinicella indica]
METIERFEQPHPLVRRVLAPNPSPFTYTGTWTHIVGAGEGLAVIDPGPDDADHIARIIGAVGDASIAAIVCTHTHRDHSPAARALAEKTGAPIVGCAPLAIEDLGPRADAAFDFDYTPDRILADGEWIAGDDWTLEAVETPGHTSNHLCFALPEADILFSGDHVMGWSTSIVSPPDGDMAAYMASLDKLLAREEALYLPAHGPAIENPRKLVRGMLMHRRQRERQILRQLEQGEGSVPEMVKAMYRGVDPRLHPAAERSVLAHLIDLRARGLVMGDGAEWRLAA